MGRVRLHLPVDFLERSVAELTTTELRNWRDTLRKKLAPATVNRTSAALKAVLNRAAIHDERIINRRAWDVGLLALPDAEQSRNVILTDDQARTVIAAACYLDKAFGLFVEVAAITGARPSQLAKLTVADLQNDSHAPFLLMPTSAKGRGQKAQLQRRNSITIPLAGRLHAATEGRCRTEKLLTKTNGTNWGKSDHTRPFRRAVTTAGLNPAEVTIYALRHSSIVRQLLAGVPTRVVAANHDTSVAMLERTYSRHIGDHADQIVRAGLLTAD